MNERIRQIRNTLNLSAEKFGARIGVTRSAISKMECGNCNISEQSILSICREFNVNETWLRTGDGEMFNKLSPDEETAYLIGKTLPNAPDFVKNTFLTFSRLSEEFTEKDWAVIKKFVDALSGKDN